MANCFLGYEVRFYIPPEEEYGEYDTRSVYFDNREEAEAFFKKNKRKAVSGVGVMLRECEIEEERNGLRHYYTGDPIKEWNGGELIEY